MFQMKNIYWFCHLLWQKILISFFSLRVIGKEKLVADRPVLIASNHESFLDPPIVGIIYDTPIYFLARKTLFKGFGAWLFPRMNVIPVDQERPDMTSLKTVIKLLRANNRVIIFPEGARTEDGNLQPAAPGTGLIVAKTKVMVQPIRIFGARRALPRNSNRVTFCPITVVVGDPIEFSAQELKKGKDGYQKISDRIMDEIAKLELPDA